eukprot:6212661-Pleurochrysis_carterae.AAC.1
MGGHVAAAGGRRAGAVEDIHGYDTDRDDGENAGGNTARVAGGASGADADGQPYTKRIEDASDT